MLESDNLQHSKRDVFAREEVIIKFKQRKSEDGTRPQSQFILPASYKSRNYEPSRAVEQPVCAVTGQPAKYRDPISGLPFASLEAFKILREKFFQKEEERLFVRIQALSDMLQKKKD